MNHLEQFLGGDWQIRPAGGATGEAYIAEQGEQKIFIKRNSSPFLAVLSAEGIVPKLLWTKRLENGDVITAQQWVDGRELKASDMNRHDVARLLAKIHRSRDLLEMFKRMGNTPLKPEDILYDIQKRCEALIQSDEEMNRALQWLEENRPVYDVQEFVVCHADVNHNNWIECTINGKDDLYLIDWDGSQVADPALDLAPLLYLYIPSGDWHSWMQAYGLELNDALLMKMRWYMMALILENIVWYEKRQRSTERQEWTKKLRELLQ
ncbi:phosphotransferase family protein [Salisediminibacterium halotolerans]|uniref:phosphotransferase family protein n=1 Tax=Salisediminibacterium halotolerans TaxID=517425 RepID=UPI0027D9BC4E|nr:phosphotransferase family protein [Salisediminibacterium halotolerans]